MSHNIEQSFEALGYGSQITVLETSDSSLLPNNSHLVYVNDSDIFVKGQDRLYRFSMDGTFKNTIGSIGQGPMEHSHIHSVSFREDSSSVCIYDGSYRILVRSYENKPVKELRLNSNGYISAAYSLPDGYWAEIRDAKNDTITYNIVWFDASGQVQKSVNLASFINKDAASYFTAPIVKQLSDNRYFYYDAFSSTGYAISDRGIEKIANVNYGKFRPETEKLNDMSYREANRNNFCELLDFSFSDDEILLLVVNGKTFRGVIIDSESGSLTFSHNIDNPRRKGGIKIWDNQNLRFWPSCTKNNIKYGLVDASEIDDEILRDNDIELNYSITEPNPCLITIEKRIR
ncbi:MAG: 6-bladed beta-propeller [Clostridium sp.]|nr:6-bladed beta-propeller [Clostridium sp.]